MTGKIKQMTDGIDNDEYKMVTDKHRRKSNIEHKWLIYTKFISIMIYQNMIKLYCQWM